MRVAVIGIGSNSVRMLVADVMNGRFDRLARDRAGTRLFAGLDAQCCLSQESMARTAGEAGRMAKEAREQGCVDVRVFATSASRDARNGEAFLSLLREITQAEPEILSGVEEAELSFLGASDVVPEGRRCGMIDIGGGSTELVLGRGKRLELAMSCQMGAVRLFRKMPINEVSDMARVEEEARQILDERLGACPGWEAPEMWVGTGGTFTVLAAMVRGVHWTDRTNMHGTRISRVAVREIGERLAGMTMAERLQLPGLQPARADIVVHGICILLAIMDRMDAEELVVSEYGNLDGYVRKHFCTGNAG